MQDPDPFADPGFLDRLGKLLPMLGSGQANEADTARRKLLEHLAQHRLSLTDVASRLRAAPGGDAAGGGPREARGGSAAMGVAELRRELDIVRHAQRASEQMARAALQQNAILQGRASRAESAQLTGVVQRRGERVALFAATTAAIGLLALVAFDHLPGADRDAGPAMPPVPLTVQPSAPPLLAARPAPPVTGSERLGSIVAHDVAVRSDPAPDSRVQGFLTHGADVVVVREVDVDGLRWVMVRSSIGIGYVPSFSVTVN